MIYKQFIVQELNMGITVDLHPKRYLDFLSITQAEFSSFMRVNERTVRRWVKEPSKMPLAAKYTLMAWAKLHSLGRAWMPGSIDLLTGEKL